MGTSDISPSKPHVVVLHETDGRKYLEALDVLLQTGEISSLRFGGSSVLWRFLHAIVRERISLWRAYRIAIGNFGMLFRLASLRDKIIVIAIAPWDFRLCWLIFLARRNRIIYNTSWPWWTGDRVPRRYGILTSAAKRTFCFALRHPNVTVVAVTKEAAGSIAECLPGLQPRVIPHAVSDVFYRHRAHHRNPFRLLFLGELSDKKGFPDFIALAESFGSKILVDIVGDGPLRNVAHEASTRPGWCYHGQVKSREKLAVIITNCQVLVALSQRTPAWEELFGMAIIEAMAVGVPCVTGDHIGPKGFIRHKLNGFLARDTDLVAVKDWITLLMEEPYLWQSISSNAVETARQFSISKVTQQWHSVLINNCMEVANIPDVGIEQTNVGRA